MKKDLTPWLLLPSIVLTLSGVTLLAPHQAALAGPPIPTQAVPLAPAGDGEGDELLEHWGDPQFSQEEQKQMAGMAAGFLVLGATAAIRRARRNSRLGTVPMPSEADFLKLAPQITSDLSLPLQEHAETGELAEIGEHSDTRKAA